MNIIDIAKLAVLVVLFLSSVAVCRPIVDFSSIDLDGRDSSAVNALNAIDHGPVYPTTAIAASVVSPYRMEEIRHQRVKKNEVGGRRQKRKSRMVCPIVSRGAAEEKSHWIRNTCFGGFVTVVSDNGSSGGGHHRSRAVARLEGISKYDSEAAFVKETCYDEEAGPLSSEVITRLYHAESRRYICFNKKGKIRTVTRRRAEKMGRQCMFLERAVESEGKQTVQYASLHRPEWLLGFNGRKRRLETTPQGDKIALARSFSSGKRVAEDRCDFLFSTGEYRENVRDNWGGLFDLIENHVDAAAEENISTRTASGGGGGLGSSGRDNSGGDIGSALDAVLAVGELAEDLLHNDKKTEDDEEESVEEPMQVQQRKISRKKAGGPVPSEDWESGPAKSTEGERISTHSRRRHRHHNRVRRHRRKRKGNLPAFVERRRILPSGRSDAGRSPAGRGRGRDRRHERPRGSPDSRSRVGGSR